jgi:EAL domain-containing protein (putative c-di-GMP-specific phosphodiesterase class I)
LITNLGMTSVAEGVEESGQLAILQSLGCSMAQGYLFSAPVSAEQLPFALESAERPALLARGT